MNKACVEELGASLWSLYGTLRCSVDIFDQLLSSYREAVS